MPSEFIKLKRIVHDGREEKEMPNELKLCPFCGGEAKATLVSKNTTHVYAKYRGRYAFVGCPKCGITTSLYNAHNNTHSPLLNESNTKRAYQKAIDDWNRRANDET